MTGLEYSNLKRQPSEMPTPGLIWEASDAVIEWQYLGPTDLLISLPSHFVTTLGSAYYWTWLMSIPDKPWSKEH